MPDIDDFSEDDISDIASKLNKADKVQIPLTPDYNKPLVIKYDFVDLGDTDYGFDQQFEGKETELYFTRLKYLSSETIYNLTGDAFRELHLFENKKKSKKLISALKTIFPECKKVDDLVVFHFALYTNKKVNADRDTGVRSPRVYFLVGSLGKIYILFFDPYHELNPMSRH